MPARHKDTTVEAPTMGVPSAKPLENAAVVWLRRPLVGAPPLNHRVKSWPHLFELTRLGVKTHELRRSTDRDYRAGDLLTLQEFEPATKTYTGRELIVRITYVTSAQNPCALSEGSLDPGYCILSIIMDLAAADDA